MLVWSASSTCHRDHSQSTNTFCFQKLKTAVCCQVTDSSSLAPCLRAHVARLGFAGENGKYPLSTHSCYRTLHHNRNPSRAQSRDSKVQTDRHIHPTACIPQQTPPTSSSTRQAVTPFYTHCLGVVIFIPLKTVGCSNHVCLGLQHCCRVAKWNQTLPKKLKSPVGQT